MWSPRHTHFTASHLNEAQCVSGDSGTATLHCVVDELVRFRLKVRQYALATPGATGEARRQQLQERQPLLEACDALRQDLATHGINVKVSNTANKGDSSVTRDSKGADSGQSSRFWAMADVEGYEREGV